MPIFEVTDEHATEWWRAADASEARRLHMAEHGLNDSDVIGTTVTELADPSRVYLTIEVTADTLLDGPPEMIATTDH